MEVGSYVAVTILVKETKSKTERILVSWAVLQNESGVQGEE